MKTLPLSLALGGAAALLAAPAAAADWPQLQHDAARTGHTDDALGASFQVAWSQKLDPVSTNVQPIVVGGAVVVGTSRGELIAFEVSTGAQRWKYATSGPIRATAASDGKAVFVGSADRHLHAVDLATGKALWKVRFAGPLRAAPAVVGDAVYVASNGGDVVRLAAADGGVKWHVELDVPTFVSPAVADGKVHVLPADGELRALDAESGATVWSRTLVGQPPSRGWVVAAEGVVFASMRGWMEYWDPLIAGTDLIDQSALSPWSVQREAVNAHRAANPAWHELWAVSSADGSELPLPIMTAWRGIGDLSHLPVCAPGAKSADVMYRWSTGEKNNTGGGQTVIGWSQHLGSWSFVDHDITPHDNDGLTSKKSGDQAFLITDEGWGLTRASSEVLVSSWHGLWAAHTGTHRLRAIARGTGGLQGWPGTGEPLPLFSTEAEATSHEGADPLPPAISEGSIYWLTENQLFALRGAP